jgi:O-antigen/teichoic acid export membrane protein
MAVKPARAPPIVELRRRGRRRRLKRQLGTALMVIAAIVIPVLGLLYSGSMPQSALIHGGNYRCYR